MIIDVHNVRGPRSFTRPIECAADYYLNNLTRSYQPSCDLGSRAIEKHAAQIDHCSRLATRQARNATRNDLIQAQSSVLFGHLETSWTYSQCGRLA